MKNNFPFSYTSNNLIKNSSTSVFSPTPPTILPNPKNYLYIPPLHNSFGYWNKYQNIYNQIISHDKTAINNNKNKCHKKIEYKPFVSNIKIIYNEDTDSNKLSNYEENEKNKCDTFLGIKKKKPNDIFEINKSTSTNNDSFSSKKNRGRKKKEVTERGNHTKFTDDNMMRKIKCHFLNDVNNKLNASLKESKNSFLKLDNLVNENLKRDYNIALMNRTFKEIYLNSKISNKYKRRNSDINKQLVEKIYLENKEIDTIKILDKTYYELFTELINFHLDDFCNEIIKKEEKNGLPHEQASNFKDKMKYLCTGYKDWFEKKKGREGKRIKV